MHKAKNIQSYKLEVSYKFMVIFEGEENFFFVKSFLWILEKGEFIWNCLTSLPILNNKMSTFSKCGSSQ